MEEEQRKKYPLQDVEMTGEVEHAEDEPSDAAANSGSCIVM